VFQYNPADSTGRFINDGLFDLDVRQVAQGDNENNLIYAATRTGIVCYGPAREITDQVILRIKDVMFPDLPELEDVISKALKHAESSIVRDRQWIKDAKKSNYMPSELRLTAFTEYEKATQYDRTYRPSVVSGRITIGPDDKYWVEAEDEDYSFEVRMKWNPGMFAKDVNVLNIQNRLSKEVKRQRKLIARVRRLYVKYVKSSQEFESTAPGIEKIMKHLEVERFAADLDALTGYYFSENINRSNMKVK